MPAVSLQNISKCYLVYESPMKALTRMVAPKMVVPEEVWALKDIDFQVKKGECLGIIGNNGSGKSTLLAIIGGIITPTTGEVAVDGRLSTLLDLTVGMQGDLSGQDNVILLGGLLGLTRAQVSKRAKMMVDFAELGDAIHRPVKTYSTGMAMRLGFSVALHVDFDILVVDEVLAVGDSNFHRKCINRMRDLHINKKKSIIIASHGLGEIASLTDRLILLNQGKIVRQGKTEDVLEAYWQDLEKNRNKVGQRVMPEVNPYGDDLGDVKIEDVRLLDHKEEEPKIFNTGEPLVIEIWFNANRPVENPMFRVQIFRNDGVWVHGMNSARHGCMVGPVYGRGCMRLKFDKLNLLEAEYYVSVGIWPDEYTSFITNVAYDAREMAYILRVKSARQHGAGVVFHQSKWTFMHPEQPETKSYLAGLQHARRFPPDRAGPKPEGKQAEPIPAGQPPP